MWSTPKTNWLPTDFENVEDLNRQKNNLVFAIKEILPKLGFPGLPATQLPDWQENENVFYGQLQELDDMIDAIGSIISTFPAVDWPTGRQWSPEMLNNSISYEDYNRWEVAASIVDNIYFRAIGELQFTGVEFTGEDDWV